MPRLAPLRLGPFDCAGLLDQYGRPIPRSTDVRRISQLADAVHAQMTTAPPATSQSVNISASGTSDGSGNVTIKGFPQIPNGLALEGTVNILAPSSPASAIGGAQWVIQANGVTGGQWVGASTGGPFVIQGPASPTITGSGLVAGTLVTATISGNQGDPSLFSSYPAALPGSINIAGLGVGSILYPFTSGLAAASVVPIAVNPNTRTLLIRTTFASQQSLFVTGATSGYQYYGAVPYLGAGGGPVNYLSVVPINPLLDPIVSVQPTGSGTWSMEVVGDTAQYMENVFYNGQLKSASATIAAVAQQNIILGPCRLLTVDLWVSGANSGGVAILPALNYIIQRTGIAGAVVDGSLSIPDQGRIMPPGSGAVLFNTSGAAGAVTGSVGYAYP